jgi:uncharacterized protein YjiK
MSRFSRLVTLTLFTVAAHGATAIAEESKPGRHFQRVATFQVCENTSCDRAQVELTAAEIVAASEDGETLVYTDSPNASLGFVDISDEAHPQPLGALSLDGEPTSVAVVRRWALVAVDTSQSFVAPSGYLAVFDLDACAEAVELCAPLEVFELDGQPDSVAVSPDQRFAAIAIENQRDEDWLVDEVAGGLPQLPGGALAVLSMPSRRVREWSLTTHDLSGLAAYAPDDPEPEYVSINRDNVVAITLQENNHVALFDLNAGEIVGHFTAGEVALEGVDARDDQRLDFSESLSNLKREPDAVAWLDEDWLVTANEGDLVGGSRGFTIFDKSGNARFDSGAAMDRLALSHGHYPDGRSDAKGTEPEGVAVASYGSEQLLFVGSERGNFVAVYGLSASEPDFRQLLPTGMGPEGLLPIARRDLFVAASEEDEDTRSTISIYQLRDEPPSYPTVVSAMQRSGPLADRVPIGWLALSGLAADRWDDTKLYTAHDAALRESRLYVLDVAERPAVITDEIVLRKDGASVDYDIEGLAQRADGSFWVVSEGAKSDEVTTPNLLVEVSKRGEVVREVSLPKGVSALQRAHGFEGVAVTGEGDDELVYVAFQREWDLDPTGLVRIGRYSPKADSWAFFYYPLEYPLETLDGPEEAWVGLSEIVAVDHDSLLLLERDNQAGPAARVKRLYEVSIASVTPVEQGGAFPRLEKRLVRDLLPDLAAPAGFVQEKVESVTVAADGQLYVVTDNDGLDGNTGETQLLRLGD